MTSPVDELMAMGYSEVQADKALEIAQGDLEQAVGFLLMGEQSRAGFDYVNASFSQGTFVRDPSINLGTIGEIDVAETGLKSPPPPSGNNLGASSSSKQQELMNMGYTSDQAEQALQVAKGDLDQAVNFLLMGESRAGFVVDVETSVSLEDNNNHRQNDHDGDLALAAALQQAEIQEQQQRPESAMYHSTGMRSNANVPKMVATQSFLTIPGAGPFCTCMAASKFLNGGVMTSEGLNTMLQGGTELYRKTSGNSEYSIDKVLKKFGKSHLQITGEDEPTDGVFMEHDLKHDTGLRKLLAQCRIEQQTGWGVILMETKNDSFCICLPPKGSKNKFWYFDFVPRPIFRVPGAYARVHSSLLSLEESLESILKKVAQTQEKEFVSFSLYTIHKLK